MNFLFTSHKPMKITHIKELYMHLGWRWRKEEGTRKSGRCKGIKYWLLDTCKPCETLCPHFTRVLNLLLRDEVEEETQCPYIEEENKSLVMYSNNDWQLSVIVRKNKRKGQPIWRERSSLVFRTAAFSLETHAGVWRQQSDKSVKPAGLNLCLYFEGAYH